MKKLKTWGVRIGALAAVGGLFCYLAAALAPPGDANGLAVGGMLAAVQMVVVGSLLYVVIAMVPAGFRNWLVRIGATAGVVACLYLITAVFAPMVNRSAVAGEAMAAVMVLMCAAAVCGMAMMFGYAPSNERQRVKE